MKSGWAPPALTAAFAALTPHGLNLVPDQCAPLGAEEKARFSLLSHKPAQVGTLTPPSRSFLDGFQTPSSALPSCRF